MFFFRPVACSFIRSDSGFDFLPIGVIIRQGGMNLSQG